MPGSSCTGPESAAGTESGMSGPQMMRTPSLKIKMSAKVASTWDRWSRA